MAFNPRTEYDVSFEAIPIRDFYDYQDEFVVRPPYQRKSVWSRKKQQDLLDSLFRRYYIPRIVIREVRLSDHQTLREVIDGQQRITSVQLFLGNQLPLPKSLADIHPELPGAYYRDLSAGVRRFVDRELKYNADIVKGIDNPHDAEHQRVAPEIFWRLQQGESLNYMEVAHARLSSLVRNFVVKYGDDYDFDYVNYRPLDRNPNKHRFFTIYDRDNDRMQHLSLLARLPLVELADGPTETKDKEVSNLIDATQIDDGIGNYSYEEVPEARALRRNLDILHTVFKDDPILDDNNALKEFRIEYFVISIYILLRHLAKHYVFEETERELFREFVLAFHERWKAGRENDHEILVFSDNRQQSKTETEIRDRIIRQAFFEFITDCGHQMITKDEQRGFSEAERIAIYQRDNGLCQMCLAEGKPEREAVVSWSEYEADHVIPHSKGGETTVFNGQVLCRIHNRRKGAASDSHDLQRPDAYMPPVGPVRSSPQESPAFTAERVQLPVRTGSARRVVRRGKRTPEGEYYRPILQALVELGGRSKLNDVLELVYEQMQDVLNDYDRSPVSSDGSTPNWKVNARWARATLVKQGLLRSDSPHGTWEISDEGRAWLEEN